MLDSLSTTGFIAALVAFITLTMIVLQACVNRAVSSMYLIAFFASVVVLAVTLR